MGRIGVRRVYESPVPGDGRRLLVDRLWPRGLSKDAAALDGWYKEVAPSDALRRWYGHDPHRFPEFRRRYRAELRAAKDSVEALLQEVRRADVVLLYAAHDAEHNNAVVLREYLKEHAHA